MKGRDGTGDSGVTDSGGLGSAGTLPSSRVHTFLIADVRGYSSFTLKRGDEAAARLADRFADLVEEVVVAWDGRVLELRGDEALAVFVSARQALRAAVALQDRFGRETDENPSLPLAVGIGLDIGEAIPVKGGYRGAALNLAARLCSLARAGEVLASEGVVHLVRKTEGIAYLERGTFEVKGFADAVHVTQVISAHELLPDDVSTKSEDEAPVDPSLFEVSLLGPFMLRRGGATVGTDSWQRRMESLFKVVATAPNRRRSRDEIVELLWPDTSPQAGAGNLRLVVHLLRRALEDASSPDLPSPLRSERGWIGLDAAYTWEIDLERFEQLLRAGGDRIDLLEEAAALYRGTPLAEDLYDDWAEPIRERVQRQWRDLCLKLASLYLARRAADVAAGWFERALEADPLDEEALRGLIKALGDAGRATEAVRRFRHFEQRLQEEIGVSPDPETLATLESITSMLNQVSTARPLVVTQRVRPHLANVVPSYPLPLSGPLRGRQMELNTILTMLPGGDGSSPGPPGFALVAADAGMGKTRLLSEVARRAATSELLVLAGGCYEEEGRLPYGPLHDALFDYIQAQPDVLLQSQLGQLLPLMAEIVPEVWARIPILPETQSTDPQARRLRLYSTVAQVFQRISAERSLLLLLDDLHWADESTLQLLHFLLRQTGMQNVLIVGAYRTDEVIPGTPLAQLVDRAGTQEGCRVVELGSLSEEEMTTLLADRLGGACSLELAATLHQRSAGNPFFSVQMMQLLQQEGSLRKQDDRWSLATDVQIDLPPAVRDTVARRLRHITSEARSSLALGAVLGREFDYVALEAITDLTEDVLFEALDAADDAGILRETGSGYAFVHPLLWEVVYGRVPDQRRRRLHDRAGLALEELYGEETADHAPELAWHFLESGNGPRALTYSLLAAARAERVVAHGEAERYYRSALPLARSLADRRKEAEALQGLGGVLKAVARLDEAVEALEESARLYRELGDLDAEGRAAAQDALTHYFRGTQKDGLSFVEPIVKRMEERDNPDRPSHALALLYAALPRLLGDPLGRFEDELRTAKRAAQLAQAVGDSSLLAAASLRQGTALWGLRQLEPALVAYEEAMRLAEPIEDLFDLAAASCFATDILVVWGQMEKALKYADRAFRAAERRGGLEQMGGIIARAHDVTRDMGRWDQAAEYSERYLSLQQSLRGEIINQRPLLCLGEIALLRGNAKEADLYFDRCLALTSEILREGREMRIATLRAEWDLVHDSSRAALDRLEPLLDRPFRRAPSWTHSERAQLQLAAVWAFADSGRIDEAASLAAQVVHNESEPLDAVVRADARRMWAVILTRMERWDAAAAALNQAVDMARDMSYPYGEARALHEHGLMCLRTGDLAHAHAKLEQALAIFRRLGACAYIERTERELGALPAAR